VLVVAGGCGPLRVGIGGTSEDGTSSSTPRTALSASDTSAASSGQGGTPDGAGSSPGVAESSADTSEEAASPRVGLVPRIGYISLDDDIAFVRSASDSIRSSVAAAGLELVTCDADWTREGVLACADYLGDIGIDGLISFQPFGDLAGQVCEMTGAVPTAGIVFDQGPCQVTRLAIDQAESGRLAGQAVGRFARKRWDCEISAFVSLESSDRDVEGRARMDGYRAGYEEQCPMPSRTPVLDGADRLVTAQTQVARLLESLRGRRIIVAGINEDAILGAMAAAGEAGRRDDLWYSGQLADPPIRRHIACDPHYLASVSQSPERFGSEVVPVLLRAMDGHDVPSTLQAPLTLITADNVREAFPDTPDCSE
jgi:ribose transport system substrate-binding protein